MISSQDQQVIDSVLLNFDVPNLTLDSAEDVGPDEKIYFLHDEDGHQFGIWVRDYMGDLLFEEEGLRKMQNINIAKWFQRKNATNISDNDDKYKTFLDGNWYALFLIC